MYELDFGCFIFDFLLVLLVWMDGWIPVMYFIPYGILYLPKCYYLYLSSRSQTHDLCVSISNENVDFPARAVVC
jgi:hypothetical protein